MRKVHAFGFCASLGVVACQQPRQAEPVAPPPAIATAEESPPTTGPEAPTANVKRGTNAANYEGVYDANGRYRFTDCSPFEAAVASAMADKLFRGNPDADESKVTRLVARKFKLKPDVVMAIYSKGIANCGIH